MNPYSSPAAEPRPIPQTTWALTVILWMLALEWFMCGVIVGVTCHMEITDYMKKLLERMPL